MPALQKSTRQTKPHGIRHAQKRTEDPLSSVRVHRLEGAAPMTPETVIK